MNGIYDWGLSIVMIMQALGGGLGPVFRFFTFLGEEEFYILLLPLVAWCIHFGMGARLGVLILVSAYTTAS